MPVETVPTQQLTIPAARALGIPVGTREEIKKWEAEINTPEAEGGKTLVQLILPVLLAGYDAHVTMLALHSVVRCWGQANYSSLNLQKDQNK